MCRLNDDKVNLEKSEFQLRPQINHAKETNDTSSESLDMYLKAVGRTRAWQYYGSDTPTYHEAILLHVYYIGCMIILKMVQHYYYSGAAERIFRDVGTSPY